jgi:hypothetical protein
MVLQERDRKPKLLETHPDLISTSPTLFASQMEALRGEVTGNLPPPSSDQERFLERFRWHRAMTKGFFQGELPEEVETLLQHTFPANSKTKMERLKTLGREIGSLHWQIFEEESSLPYLYLEFEEEWAGLVFYLLQGEQRACFRSNHRDSPLADSQYQEVLFKTSEPGVFLTAVCMEKKVKADVDKVFSSSWQWGIYVGEESRIRTEEEIKQVLDH